MLFVAYIVVKEFARIGGAGVNGGEKFRKIDTIDRPTTTKLDKSRNLLEIFLLDDKFNREKGDFSRSSQFCEEIHITCKSFPFSWSAEIFVGRLLRRIDRDGNILDETMNMSEAFPFNRRKQQTIAVYTDRNPVMLR